MRRAHERYLISLGFALFAAGVLSWIVLAWKAMANLDAIEADSDEGSGLLMWGLSGTVLMIFGMVFLHLAAHAGEKDL